MFVLGALLAMGLIIFLIFFIGQAKQTAEGFKKYRFLLANLITRDLKVKYRRSFLGLMWSVLNPLLMALVINAVFSNIFKFKIDYFIVYYLSGSLIFNFMSEATSTSLTSVIDAASLIKKVYIPKYIFPLEKCLFAFVNMLFSSIALIVVILIVRMPVHLTALMFFFPMICTLIFSVGMSLILSSINVFFRDVGHLYSVWTVAWMYLTPVIYPVDVLPEKILPLMKLNPMFHYVTYFREVVMYGNIPGLNSHIICLLFAFTFLGIGLVMFKKQQDRFILHI
jgi:ABC-2 type transport system permease protein